MESHQVSIEPCADQAPDQVPYNDESDLETESDHALDEVSSDVEINPEDLANILGDEGEDEDEDAKWVTDHLLLSYNIPC